MPDTKNRPLRVFLCHASDDKAIVRELYRQLCAEGWMDIWFDEEKLLPGQEWDLEIEKAVEAADAVVICLSNHSVSKEGYIQRELRFVLNIADQKPEGTIFVIPVRLDDCPIPRRLRMWQYVDYFPANRRMWAYSRILQSLKLRVESICLKILASESLPTEQQNVKPTTLDNTIEFWGGTKFIKISAGEFLMGSKKDNDMAWSDEKPQFSLVIPYDYWIARFPVTNAQYSEFVGDKFTIPRGKEGHPVVNVSWQDAQNYIFWLNRRFEKYLPFEYKFRLPTEAEWEKAARGTDGREWPWGELFDKEKCNSSESGRCTTTHIGAYSPKGDSPYGIADMGGNVWEWTHSLYKKYPYKANDGRERLVDTEPRVVRGGSFGYEGRRCRPAFRFSYLPHLFNDSLGFRIAVAPAII